MNPNKRFSKKRQKTPELILLWIFSSYPRDKTPPPDSQRETRSFPADVFCLRDYVDPQYMETLKLCKDELQTLETFTLTEEEITSSLGNIPAIITELGLDFQSVQSALQQELGTLDAEIANQPLKFSRRGERIFIKMAEECARLYWGKRDKIIGKDSFYLLALTKDEGSAGRFLRKMGITHDKVLEAIKKIEAL